MKPRIGVQTTSCDARVEHCSDNSCISNFSLVFPLVCRQIYLAAFLIFSPGCLKDLLRSQPITDCIVSPPPTPTWPFSSVSCLSEPHDHPSGYTGQKWWQPENLSPLDISHPNYLWNICTLLCLPPHHPELPSPLTWKGGNSQLIRLPASTPPLLPHSPHCSLSDLFKMQSKLFTPWWKLGDFSLPVRAKPNSVNSHSTPAWSGPHPLKPPHTTLTLYFLCVQPTDLSAPPRHSRLLHSHFSAYNSFPLLFI